MSFLNFLNEQIILGLIISENDPKLYRVRLSSITKSDVFITPITYKDGYIKIKISPEGLNFIKSLLEDYDDKENYPYKNFKKIISDSYNKIKKYFIYDESLFDMSNYQKIIASFKSDELAEKLSEQISSHYRFSQYKGKEGLVHFKGFLIGCFDHRSIILDVRNKKIKLETHLDYQDRIGVIQNGQQSKKAYIIPRALDNTLKSDFSTVKKILKSLVKKYPFINNFTYIDSTTTKNEVYKINELLGGKDVELNKASSVNSIVLNNIQKSIKVYHGTSERTYKDYISKEGLRPNKGQKYHDKFDNFSEKNVYFTTSLGEARKYAVRASGASSRSVVLEVEIDDISKITFDEDYLHQIMNKLNKKVLKEITLRILKFIDKENIPEENNKWPFRYTKDGMKQFDYDNLPAEVINMRALVLYTNYKEIKQIVDFIGGLALKSENYTFAYKGHIKPDKIKIKESFKSKEHNEKDSNSEFMKKYAKILRSTKYGK